MGPTEEQQSTLSNCCSRCLEQSRCTCDSTVYRLKWNWFYLIVLSALVSNGASSPMGTLYEFVINPRFTGGNGQQFEPGLGMSEEFYSWVISVNNIGGFLGGIAGIILSSTLPYWFSFMISVACHTVGFLLYAVVTHGWMLVIGRMFVGIFTGLHRALTFAYFAVTYEYYITTKEDLESKKYCRIKDMLFALYTVSTSLGYLIGAGVSIIFSRIRNIDHFRVIGWYNVALGFAFFVLLVFTFHGEFKWKAFRKIVAFLIACTAVIKSRMTIYEELFNPILSDTFGFSEDNTVYFFLIILVAPILGGLLLFLIQWIRVNNIIISIFGILATITALLIMSDWQAALNDNCLEFSLYHNPHFGSSGVIMPGQYCWNTANWSTMKPNYHITGGDHGHLEVMLLPNNHRRLTCDIYHSSVSCDACNTNRTFKANLLVDDEGSEYCLKTYPAIGSTEKDITKELSIKCHGATNESCDNVCLYLYDTDPQTARFQNYNLPTTKQSYKSLLEDVYTQSLKVVNKGIYNAAMQQCEAHTKEHCHWIPNSLITKEHCGDCQPICRSEYRTLNFVQFSIGAFWFMLSMPVAEVSLPLVISDSVREEFQGIVMGVTVASSELLQGITPLWLNAAYEASGKRTFLPNVILIATFLPFLFVLCAIYQTVVKLHRTIHPNYKS